MLRKAKKQNLSQDIMIQILHGIEAGMWLPGEKLPKENELASTFGVSRNCIREALKALSLNSIIESKPGQGTFISQEALTKIFNSDIFQDFSGETTLIELLQIRILLEPQLAFWATQRASKHDIEKLIEIIRTSNELDGKDLEKLTYVPIPFHQHIAKMSQHHMAIRVLNLIAKGEVIHRKILSLTPFEFQKIGLSEHEKIAQFIQQRDAHGAKKAMYDHLSRALKDVITDMSRFSKWREYNPELGDTLD